VIRILLVDDHAVVRQGLRMFLALDPELCVVGEAQDGQEALEQARELKPDVVLMDLLMPGMGAAGPSPGRFCAAPGAGRRSTR
jgi:DNA-binding NarL/FixJ family response regulator